MGVKKTVEVEFINDDCVYIDGRQFLSLSRFHKRVGEFMVDAQRNEEQAQILLQKNKNLHAVIKDQFEQMDTIPG